MWAEQQRASEQPDFRIAALIPSQKFRLTRYGGLTDFVTQSTYFAARHPDLHLIMEVCSKIGYEARQHRLEFRLRSQPA